MELANKLMVFWKRSNCFCLFSLLNGKVGQMSLFFRITGRERHMIFVLSSLSVDYVLYFIMIYGEERNQVSVDLLLP